MMREDIQKNVIAILKNHVGESNAILASNLYISATAYTLIPAKAQSQTRILRSIIKDLRYNSYLPVVSGSQGYWLAETPDEFIAYLESEKNIAMRQFKLRLKGIKAVAARIAKQKSFNFNPEEISQ